MDAENILSQVCEILEEILDDRSVPRNIRKTAEDVKSILVGKDRAMRVRVNEAINRLDDISNDPNLPEHTRTDIWNIASTLETLQR
ncbi:MAG: UPF0147 family protein [Candidatus Undinarchaeales archaeon]|nr:UPF0147 family protein [Candidatus Undinarchaeales archaeon]MDP7492407.1 UPF0147 family protein [Candidatus Undinarchaeales archaeon]